MRVGGVPEHVNLPWYLALESGAFARCGLDVRWIDQPAGTGAMMAALDTGGLDVAVALTEGTVAAIDAGLAATVVSVFVTSPLQWGIHVAASSSITDEADPALATHARFAVSRIGSGSHLMAAVLAERLGWPPLGDDRFVVVGGLDGARTALPGGDAELFLWDRFMTQPLVDEGTFRRIGVQPTPWPAFVIAVRDDLVAERPGAVDRLVTVAATSAALFERRRDAVDLVVGRFGLGRDVAEAWLAATRWSAVGPLDVDVYDRVREAVAPLT